MHYVYFLLAFQKGLCASWVILVFFLDAYNLIVCFICVCFQILAFNDNDVRLQVTYQNPALIKNETCISMLVSLYLTISELQMIDSSK